MAEKLLTCDREILATGSSTVEERIPVGYMGTYSTTKAVYRDPEGKILGLVGIAREITEPK